MSQKHLEVVLFDLGNTLIYFDGDRTAVNTCANQVLVQALSSMGYPLPSNEFSAAFSEKVKEYFLERDRTLAEGTMIRVLRDLLMIFGFHTVPLSHLERALCEMYSISEAHWRLESDAISMLEQLNQSGFHLGLISNAGDASNVHRLLLKGNLNSFFDIVVISAEIGIRKPHPNIFNTALSHFKVSPDVCVMVGDTLEADILGASKMGMGSIWVKRRVPMPLNEVLLDPIVPDVTINDLSELPELVNNWGDQIH